MNKEVSNDKLYNENFSKWAENENMSDPEMVKPFVMDKEFAQSNEEDSKPEMVKPFVMDDLKRSNNGKDKLYLVLFYIDCQDSSEYRQEFQFVKGRQELYDIIKTYLTNDLSVEQVDAMKSLVFVDSPKVQISHKYSIYAFMRDMKERDLIKDDTDFDINDYYYEEQEEDEQE